MNRYSLITGACGGLGGAFVELLAKAGQPLFLTGRSEERLSELKRSLHERYPALEIDDYPCDLTDRDSRQRFFSYIDKAGATFDRLIYVAGADTQMAFERYSEEKLVFQTRVNFEGAVSFTRGVMARCPLDGKSEFLAVGSVSALYPMPYFALYSATKKALEQFYLALHVELKGRAKVTCVLPGAIPTREDIKENIKTQGIWGKLAALPPTVVAQKSLKAVERNRRRTTIGFWNRAMRLATALLPMSVKLKYIARRWSKTEKDAF